jgi:hypothetical protein
MAGMYEQTTSGGSGLTRTPSGPDLKSYRDLHRALLVSANNIVDALSTCPPDDRRRWRALERWFTGYRGELQHHHHVEDHIFFPALGRKVPSYGEYSATIDDDHAMLDRLIERSADAIRALADQSGVPSERRDIAVGASVELRDHLATHLAFEDDDILPMFERHLSVAEYAELERQALLGVSLRQAWFTVPWYMSTVEPQTAVATWEDAPAAMKILHVLSRRPYARLTRRAFGSRS